MKDAIIRGNLKKFTKPINLDRVLCDLGGKQVGVRTFVPGGLTTDQFY